MRFRQIHLDFHTSEKITDVGSKFDPQQFQEMLKLGSVDSVTLFSKCHHGMTYHETKVGVRHPHLTTELCRARSKHAAPDRSMPRHRCQNPDLHFRRFR